MPRTTSFHPGRGPYITQSFRTRQATSTAPVVTPPPAPVTPLSAALDLAEQSVVFTLQADWDRDGYNNALADLAGACSSVTVEISATGDLPIEAGLVEGFASSQLTAVLDGTLSDGSTQAADAFAPYRTDSALYGKALLTAPVTCSMGLNTDSGPSLVQQFTGQVRTIRVDSGTRSAELIAADPAELLREAITLPAYSIDRTTVALNQNWFGVRSQAIIDYVLRQNGIYASPPPHPQAQISCTGHGWLAAEIGLSGIVTSTQWASTVATFIEDDAWWVPGPFNMLAVRGVYNSNNTSFQSIAAREQFRPAAGTGIGMAAWVYVGNDMNLPAAGGIPNFLTLRPLRDSSFQYLMYFDTTGALTGSVQGTTSFAFVNPSTAPAQWQYVALHFQHNVGGTTTIRFRQNGITSSGSGATPGFSAAVAPFCMANIFSGSVSWSNFQVWYDFNPPSGAWPGEVHTTQVSGIDPGLNLMTTVPDVVNADSWTVIKDTAAAEYGLAGFDQSGKFYFKSRDHATDPTSIEKTATADTSLLALSTTNSIDSVRNLITTETVTGYSDRSKTSDHSTLIVEAKAPGDFDSGALKTTVWAVPMEYSALPLDFGLSSIQNIPQLSTATWNDDVLNGYAIVSAESNYVDEVGVPDGTGGPVVAFIMAGQRLGWLVVYNNISNTIRFSTVGGTTPALRVQGYKVTPDPSVINTVSDLSSMGIYGTRTLALPASPYRQLVAPMEAVASSLLSELKIPVPVLDQITINGDPRLSIGDTIQLVDPNTNGSMLASIVKISRKLAGGQLTDTLSVRPVFPP